MVHFSADVPLNGTCDEWPRRPGHAGRELLVRTRTLVWASFVHEKQRQARRDHYLHFGTVSGAFPKSVEVADPFAPGSELATPRRQRIEAIDEHVIGSSAVFNHMLWKVLDPQSDLRSCYDHHRSLMRVLDEPDQHDPLRLMHAYGAKPSLDPLGALSARVRLAKHAGDNTTAFAAGRDITKALCYLSLSKEFRGSIEEMVIVVVRTVLAGLGDGSARFAPHVEAYLPFIEVLWKMQENLNSVTGRSPLGFEAHGWHLYVEAFSRLIEAFCQPGAASREELEEAVETALGECWIARHRQDVTPFERV
ncbi:hypothetical protein WGE86_22665 [Xanthomonas euvesicatoria pv. euvesicatoria]|uniref:Uncharacterized protein n=1 Tax=Xanthomonas euvesicatoria pv. euvesicatoria TaxID=2753541 RepID=A0ABS8LVA2_XANEU|nr:hypothetical protein [Xanthomonas euvesicatoria]APO92310.1 hypothetical protein BJD11_21840 [Xanthomonas euvesicatoria]MCC8515442.1 hypothetical protein [Xanthomonas euvesicatoria pv. euvesicatoria]MCC8547981.1 hypothetical protein [Xanthomonas euvesicatoria pv. euvesicatoria]MCC8580516.1 hypothetical protein [Xanthomonas euvesicatoria pv. euvesicatoria]MCC8587582.1 hypothetical protein [Xanthomonas euvesicatoria pv. euvesicatoria]